MRVGIIGFGTIGKAVADGLAQGHGGDHQLTSFLVRDLDRARVAGADSYPCQFTTNIETVLDGGTEVVVEAAGQPAVAQYGPAVLERRRTLIIASIGALSDDALFDRLQALARSHGGRILLPSGAIGGLDAVAAAAIGGLDEVSITSRKPAAAFASGPDADPKLAAATEPVCLYDGMAREAVRLFPANVNVAAALSLAGVGLDHTRIRIFCDPSVTRNTHEITARGYFGDLKLTIAGIPTANPRTGRLTALSILRTLRNLTQTVLVGV